MNPVRDKEDDQYRTEQRVLGEQIVRWIRYTTELLMVSMQAFNRFFWETEFTFSQSRGKRELISWKSVEPNWLDDNRGVHTPSYLSPFSSHSASFLLKLRWSLSSTDENVTLKIWGDRFFVISFSFLLRIAFTMHCLELCWNRSHLSSSRTCLQSWDWATFRWCPVL